MAGDPPAPWVRRLRSLTIRVRQIVTRRNIHHDERVEADFQSSGTQRPYRVDERLVARCTPVSCQAIMQRNGLRLASADAANPPFLRIIATSLHDHRLDPAVARPKVRSKPRHDQR